MCPKSGFWNAPDWLWIGNMIMTSQFANMTATTIFFDAALFILSSLVTGPSFMSISWLVVELMRIFFYKGLTRNLEIKNPIKYVLMFQCYIIGKLQLANAGHSVTLHSVRGDIPTHAAIISVNLTIIFWMYNPTSLTSVVAIKVISASLSNFCEKSQITTISSYGVFVQYLTEENIFIEVISLYNFFEI